MYKSAVRLVVGITLGLIAVRGVIAAAEPVNLSLRKQEMADYVSSGEYMTDISTVAVSAKEYVAKRILQGPTKPGLKLAIVFDIDETLLSNVSHIMANDYGYVPKVWDHWVDEGTAPAILPVKAVYDTAVQARIDIFLITGRKDSDSSGTEKNLQQVGYVSWTKIFYKPVVADKPLTMEEFKTGVRRKLTLEGYEIIANLGDQASDLANGYAERAFKLPNPFYLSK